MLPGGPFENYSWFQVPLTSTETNVQGCARANGVSRRRASVNPSLAPFTHSQKPAMQMLRHANRPWRSHFVPCSQQRLESFLGSSDTTLLRRTLPAKVDKVGWRTKIARFSRPASGTGARESERRYSSVGCPSTFSLLPALRTTQYGLYNYYQIFSVTGIEDERDGRWDFWRDGQIRARTEDKHHGTITNKRKHYDDDEVTAEH